MSGGDILREVDEALRVEKAQKVLEKHGKTIVAIIVALILGTAAHSAWKAYTNRANEQSTATFMEAIKGDNPLPTLTALSEEKKGAGSALASLSAASMAIESQEWDKAMGLYNNVLENRSAPQTYIDLARVQIASLKLDHDKDATADDILAFLSPVVADKKSAWRSRAVFIQAVIKANKKNDYKAAVDDLKTLLAEPNQPEGFVDNINALISVYRIKGSMVTP